VCVCVTEKRERWVELAELAEREHDPKNLLALIVEINSVLEEKRFGNHPPSPATPLATQE
jgi:hypothetical protein